MPKSLRIIITLLAVVAFLITAPLVILRTLGFTVDIRRGTITQTGVLVVDSSPAGAAIILDGARSGETTPARIRNLLPKTYEVRLEADGFHPWTKKLDVQSAGVTFAEDITLFRVAEPELIVDAPARSARLSPDGMWIAYVVPNTRDEVWVKNTKSGETTLLLTLPPDESLTITWSSRGDRFLLARSTPLGVDATAVILPPRAPRVAIAEILGRLPTSIHWSTDNPEEIEAVVGGSLVRIDPAARRAVPLAAVDGKEARVVEGVIYEIRPTLTSAVLSGKAAGESGEPREIANLSSLSYRIGDPRIPWLPLHDTLGERTLILQTSGSREEPLDIPATHIAWSPERREREFAFWNPFELWVADPLSRTMSLITRLGVGIDDAAWNHNGTVLYLASAGKLDAIERDDRGGRNVTTLARLTSVRDLMPSPDGRFLYFVGKKDGADGIYKLGLR